MQLDALLNVNTGPINGGSEPTRNPCDMVMFPITKVSAQRR